MKLAAIAAAIGYESESAFGKVFRRIMGISPGQYRRRHRRADDGRAPNRQRPKDRTAAQ
jgi:AraC-like DNA-binding protein